MPKNLITVLLTCLVFLSCGCSIGWISTDNYVVDSSGYKRAASEYYWTHGSFIFRDSEIRFYNGNLEETLKCKNNIITVDGTIADILDCYPAYLIYITRNVDYETKLTILSFDYEYERNTDHYLESSETLQIPKVTQKYELKLDIEKIYDASNDSSYIICQSSDNRTIFLVDLKGNVVSKKIFEKPIIVYRDFWFDGSVIGSFKSDRKTILTDENAILSNKAFITEIRSTLAVYDGKSLHMLDVNKGKIIQSFGIEGLDLGTQAGVFSYDGGICYITQDHFEYPSKGIHSPWDVYYVSKRKGSLLAQLQIGEMPSSMAGIFAKVENGISKTSLVVTKYSYDKDNIFDWSRTSPYRTYVYPIKDIPEPIEFAELIMTRDNDRQIEVRLYSKYKMYSFIHDLY